MNPMKTQPVLIFISVPSIDIAKEIAHMLVERKLAACVNILPGVTSVYAWEGKINEEEELLLVAKSWEEIFEELVPAVQAVHPYQVPEIISVPISNGLPAYLAWMGEVTQGE